MLPLHKSSCRQRVATRTYEIVLEKYPADSALVRACRELDRRAGLAEFVPRSVLRRRQREAQAAKLLEERRRGRAERPRKGRSREERLRRKAERGLREQ